MERIGVGILGVTGAIGECYADLLQNHPYFDIRFVAASDARIGDTYRKWVLSGITDIATACALGVKILFSALDTATSREIEPLWAEEFLVISSSSAFRTPDRLILPEINGDRVQGKRHGIFSKTNCTLHPILLPLYWLKEWQIERVVVTTLQAVSGAGKKGIGSMEIIDNIIPWIPNEEEKITEEFGLLFPYKPHFAITCCRVPVLDGHTVSITVDCKKRVDLTVIQHHFEKSGLFHLFSEKDRPQPRLDRNLDSGMGIGIGRLRTIGEHTLQFVALSHNRIRGAAGTGTKIAEVAYGLQTPGFSAR